MNYEAHYNTLIKRGKERVLSGYTETHHILPRCMGGGDDPENLVKLTPEEHFIAHKLLVKMYPDNTDLIVAVFVMAGGRQEERHNNRVYGWLRRRFSQKRKGHRHSPETKAKMSAAAKGRPRSEIHRKRLSEANTGRKRGPNSPEHLAKRMASTRRTKEARGRPSFLDDVGYKESQSQKMKAIWALRKSGELPNVIPGKRKTH